MCVSQKNLLYILLGLSGTIGQAQQYNWQPAQCPEACGQPAPVIKCVDSYGSAVAERLCNSYTKPSCHATPPCNPFWFADDVQCPTECGRAASTLSRPIQCKGTINGVVQVIAASYCSSYDRPSTTVQCPATPACITYQWQLGEETCPTTCGLLAHVVTRSLKCISSAGQVVDDSFCDAYSKPERILNCPATAPCAPFWFTSDVQCPYDCGKTETQQPRTVQCKGTINGQEVVIAESYCTGPKPPATVPCPATAPCAPFWYTSDVHCPEYCGLLESQQTRTVQCKGTINGQVVVIAESYCDAASKPSSTVPCPATAPCAPFWHASDVQCPDYCGLVSSTIQRDVTCKGTINNQVVEIADSYCNAASKPSTSVNCPATAPCAPFWHTSDVTCPDYCGLASSTVQRTVTCRGTINNVVVVIADSYCDAASKPSTSVNCAATAPCAPFWFTSEVQCPSYCGLLASSVTRTVQCKGTINNVVVVIAESFCDASSKPSSTVPCPATAPCAPFWFTSDVHCPDYCGLLASQQTRTVQCKGTVNGNVIVIAESYCDAGSKPSPSVTCPATAPCAPYWYTSDVYCPTECGSYGSDVPRTVLCKGTVNGVEVVVADSYCSLPKPASTKYCPATNECVSYEWRVSSEYCPTECGRLASTVTLTVTCIAKTYSNPEGSPVADSFCSYQSKPGNILNCPATPPCSPFWLASPVNCPTECGQPAKTVTRLVECRGTVNGQIIVVGEHFCSGPKPSTTVSCPATAVCVIYKWKLGDAYCPTECGHAASVVTRPLVCVAITPDYTAGNPVADSFCDAYTKPDASMQCPATEPCCAATDTPCSYDDECCSGVCVIEEEETQPPAYPVETSQPHYPSYPASKGTKKGTKGTKDTKGTKYSKGTKGGSKGTKGPYDDDEEQPYGKATKGTKDSKGTKGTKSSPDNSYGGSTSPKSTKGKSGSDNSYGGSSPKSTKGKSGSDNSYSPKSTKGKSSKDTKGKSSSPDSSYGSSPSSSYGSSPSSSSYGGSAKQSGKGKKRGYYDQEPRGTCGCLKNAASCTKDAQCCSGNCKNYVCAPKSAYVQSGDDSSRSGNAYVAAGVGVGGALGAAAVIGFVMRRRRRSKQMSREDRAASEPLTPHTKATTTPRKVDVVA